MRRQQGYAPDPRDRSASFAAIAQNERDPEADADPDDEYEIDRFTTDHDDRAGRSWRINSDAIDVEIDDARRDRTNDSSGDDDSRRGDTERGVYQTRAISTTPQDRDARGRFTAEEERTASKLCVVAVGIGRRR